ncbi:MAG: hypothetical protein SFX72_19035 [Isosphaeraceae bacterium]|nr:hypothetical protein [Isosphaeraceae bacterium]
MKARLTLAIALALPMMTIFSGCGDDSGLAQRSPVSGKVSYKGQPLAKGLISFIPGAPDGRAATGQITDGKYQLTTQDENDGAFPGTYTVTIAARVVDMTQATEAAKKKGATSAALPQDFAAKANKDAKNEIPEKYSLPTTSGLKAEVKAGSNTFDFDLVD